MYVLLDLPEAAVYFIPHSTSSLCYPVIQIVLGSGIQVYCMFRSCGGGIAPSRTSTAGIRAGGEPVDTTSLPLSTRVIVFDGGKLILIFATGIEDGLPFLLVR